MKLEWTGDRVKTVTGPIPAVKWDERRGRKIWFVNMVAAYTGWKDARNVRLISSMPNGLVGLLIRALIGGVQPTMAGGPLSHYTINRGGGRRLKLRGLPELQFPTDKP